ncbi:O-antigen polymerase [Flaviramulus aquimarinus]
MASYIVFNFMFFIVAPMLQIHKVFTSGDLKLVTKLIYSDYLIIKTSVFILIFNIVFYIAYRYFNAMKLKAKIYKKDMNLSFHILVFFVISMIIFLINIDYIKQEYLSHNYSVLDGTTKSALLIKEKIILMIPFPAFVLGVYYLKKYKKSKNFYIILIITFLMLVLILVLKNPLTEKRNALGPIYITIVFLLIPKLLNTNFKSLIFLFFSMVIIFPTISLITHSGYTLDKLINEPKLLLYQLQNHGVTNTFTTLNYDAFINFSATIEHVEKDTFSFGEQLSGAVFFFVPRKIWESKPISSGEFIGNYLRDNYGDPTNPYYFTNLSNPFVSEGYINFGLLGVILFAILLAFFMTRMVNWINGEDPLKVAAGFYASIHMIFFLRGDFTNGYAFLFATFIVILIIPKMYFSFFGKKKVKM